LKKKTDKVIDVLSHALVPDMAVLSAEEKAKVLKKFGVSDDQVPSMRATDPVAVALKANPGDLIKIKRKEETGEYLSYRIVS
jgi:DNA-directed RNA polymerase I, II, and III subunit RPABC1